MSTVSHFLNSAIGPVLLFLLIILDYIRKYNTDAYQRRLFIGMLSAALVSTVMDFFHHFFSGQAGPRVTIILYTALTLFLVAQNVTYYLAVVFIDYFVRSNVSRTRRILKIFAVLLLVYLAVALLNLKFHFFFYVSGANLYTPGAFYPLRLIISYTSLILILADVFISSKHFKPSQIYLLSFFGILTALGASLDIVFRSGSLTWPCFAAGILYFYFFIVQSDSKIDSLTGIGNRLSFNEFLDKLSRSNSKETYSIVMIDMDRFKEINDTLGHLEGDNALRDMAVILKSKIRENDFAARYGGDEFILAVRAESDVIKLMARIEQAIQNCNDKDQRPYKLQMSYGWDNYTAADKRSIKEFLAHIDSLMYKHKMEKKAWAKTIEIVKRGKKHV
jgi:diguanylate cyclase (GGDEF)-like protein